MAPPSLFVVRWSPRFFSGCEPGSCPIENLPKPPSPDSDLVATVEGVPHPFAVQERSRPSTGTAPPFPQSEIRSQRRTIKSRLFLVLDPELPAALKVPIVLQEIRFLIKEGQPYLARAAACRCKAPGLATKNFANKSRPQDRQLPRLLSKSPRPFERLKDMVRQEQPATPVPYLYKSLVQNKRPECRPLGPCPCPPDKTKWAQPGSKSTERGRHL